MSGWWGGTPHAALAVIPGWRPVSPKKLFKERGHGEPISAVHSLPHSLLPTAVILWSSTRVLMSELGLMGYPAQVIHSPAFWASQSPDPLAWPSGSELSHFPY